MEKEFNYQDSLRIIDEMIAQSKYRPGKTDSMVTLMWGYLVLAASLLHWWLQTKAGVSYGPASWLLMIAGGVVTLVVSLRSRRRQKARTFIDKMIAQLWLAFSITFGLLFIAMQPDQPAFLPVVLLLYGIGMWMQGSLIRFLPYKMGAAASWLGSLIAFNLPNEQQLLVLAGSVVLSYIVPGHLLFGKIRKAYV